MGEAELPQISNGPKSSARHPVPRQLCRQQNLPPSNTTMAPCSPVVPMALENDDRCCRSCRSTRLRTDWAAGDRICTDCGVVDDECLLDDRPEWREFDDDVGKPSVARSGLVLVDEATYLGGLQPTTLSRHVYGASTSQSLATRKLLLKINRRMDRRMEKMNKRALETAKLSRQVKSEMEDVRPEYEQMLLQEEEEANRIESALYADKWSLDRAIRLFGTPEEVACLDLPVDDQDLLERLDKKLLEASQSLYRTYSLLLESALRLELPDRVTREVTNLLCRFCVRRDGMTIRGVSKRRKPGDTEPKGHASGALCAALLFYTARHMGWPRPLAEVCANVKPAPDVVVTKKHCARAMEALRAVFPHIARPAATVSSTPDRKSSNNQSLANLSEHLLVRLRLPPVAEAAVRALVAAWHEHTMNNAKISTLCAAMTYFVCQVGERMQRLAVQTTKKRGSFTTEAKSEKPAPVTPEVSTPSSLSVEQHEYEMARVWDAWSEQMPWLRSLAEIGQSCGVTTAKVSELYERELYPKRQELLAILKDAVNEEQAVVSQETIALRATPLATVLLPKVAVVSPLLKKDAKL